MLRYVFRVHPRQGDDYVVLIRDAARKVETIAVNFGMIDWISAYRKSKWRFAGELARQQDGRWSSKILDWQPNMGHGRSRSRPRTRWADSLEMFAGGNWPNLAQDIADGSFTEKGSHNAKHFNLDLRL